MESIFRCPGFLMVCLVICTAFGFSRQSAGAGTKEDAKEVLAALQEMNRLIEEGTRRYLKYLRGEEEEKEFGSDELWNDYLKKVRELKYKAMEDAFPDVFGHPFVFVYSYLEQIDMVLDEFLILGETGDDISPEDCQTVVSHMTREKGKLEGVLDKYVLVQTKWADSARSQKGQIHLGLPAGEAETECKIDGVLSYDEILQPSAQLAKTEIDVGSFPVKLIVSKAKETYLVGEVFIPETVSLQGLQQFYVVIDGNRDGQFFTAGDDLKLHDLRTQSNTDMYYESNFLFRDDVAAGGSVDFTAASTITEFLDGWMRITVEMTLPNNPQDWIGRDVQFAAGSQVSLTLGLLFEEYELAISDTIVLALQDE